METKLNAVTIEDGEWENLTDDGDRIILRAPSLTIAGVPLHVEGYAVQMVNDLQTADSYDEDFGTLFNVFGADGPLMTAQINGREYALFASPYCD